MSGFRRVTHTFEPVFDEQSRILILGSLPSVKSRETGFYYAHPQNRFWKVIAALYEAEVPQTVEEKSRLLLSSNLAIWDVIKSCEIVGSSDSSIQNVEPLDLNRIFRSCDIDTVYANGKAAAKLYRKYQQEITDKDIVELPSTSPANAAYSLERLVEAWKIIKKV